MDYLGERKGQLINMSNDQHGVDVVDVTLVARKHCRELAHPFFDRQEQCIGRNSLDARASLEVELVQCL